MTVDDSVNHYFEGAMVKYFDVSSRPLCNLKIGSLKARIGDFSGRPASAEQRRQRRLFEREARVSSLQRSEEVQGRKMSSTRRDHDFQSSLFGRDHMDHSGKRQGLITDRSVYGRFTASKCGEPSLLKQVKI